MKRKYLILIAGILIISGLGFYYWVNRAQITPGQQPVQAASAQPEGAHQGHDAKGEDAKPQTEAPNEQAAQETPAVEIPPEKQQLMGVQVVQVAVKSLQKTIRTVGRIEYDERKQATVNAKFEGWIEKLHVDYTGRYVKKGEVLAEIYSPELLATQKEFINLLRWAKPVGSGRDDNLNRMLASDALTVVEAARERLRLWDITEDQIQKVEETGKPVRTLAIHSPVSGYVVQKMAVQGMKVMPGEKLFDIADLSMVWVIADIYEYELPLIKSGETARIGLSYFPGREFSSKIDYVYPSLAGETRTAKVRFTIPNPGGHLKPQMFSEVEIRIDLGKRLTVPEDAVIDTGPRQIVYVDKGEGYFEPREVSLGLKGEGVVEVTRGLKPGEKIASAANFLIDSEAKLKGVAPLHKH